MMCPFPSGLVMDLNDGQKSIESQSKDQREHSFKEPPTLLEVRGKAGLPWVHRVVGLKALPVRIQSTRGGRGREGSFSPNSQASPKFIPIAIYNNCIEKILTCYYVILI